MISSESPAKASTFSYRTSPEKGRNKPGVLFLALKIFSATGGIERVCRVAGKALCETTEQWQKRFNVFVMHDNAFKADSEYFPSINYRAFNSNKIKFTYSSIKNGIAQKIVILSHVNLLPVGYLIKLLSPKTKLVLIAHGIEVWRPIPAWKKKMLHKTDLILSISRFTKEKMKTLYQLKDDKFTILNNSLDPFLLPFSSPGQVEELKLKYNFTSDNFIILTLTRLSDTERNKGYDKILFAVGKLIKKYPHLKYLFVGKYDAPEKRRLDELIAAYDLSGVVVFTGFVPDTELAAHYSLADVYVMPSEKEGFGISFIEALYYGSPVIAGNRDGTADALCDGKLGTLVDPRSQQEITNAIENVIQNKKAFTPDREMLLNNFSYPVYKNKLQNILTQLLN